MAEAFSGVSSGSLEGGTVSNPVWENSKRTITLLDSLLVDDSYMTFLKDMHFLQEEQWSLLVLGLLRFPTTALSNYYYYCY